MSGPDAPLEQSSKAGCGPDAAEPITDVRPAARPASDPTAPRRQWLGRWAFTLSVVSTIVYFGASDGIRNFAMLLSGGVGKLTKMIGIGG